jgi:hypothetical protein
VRALAGGDAGANRGYGQVLTSRQVGKLLAQPLVGALIEDPAVAQVTGQQPAVGGVVVVLARLRR